MPLTNIRETGTPSGTLLQRELLQSHRSDVSLYLVTYSSEGLRVKGYLAVPDSKGPCPALIFCRGGIRKVGMPRKRRVMTMAERGYVVFAPFYRGNEGGEGRDEFGGEDRLDVIHAITMMSSLPEVKPGLVPLIGFSRGSIMALSAAKECEGVGPVVVWGGVSDLFDTYEERVDLRRMLKRVVGHPRKQIDAYQSRSPVYWVDALKVPIMIVHGTSDVLVPVRHAWKLAESLKRSGKDFAMELHEGFGHRFPRKQDDKALDAVFMWLSQKLQQMEISY
nr:prolyl oligopeptidase family serine peptidase [Paenibacillus sp. 1_12]